jgi:hypothetical protein
MVNYHFAYLFGTLLFGLVWFYIFLRRPDLRKEQLSMSFFGAVFGLTELIFFGEYWHPQFIFSFPGLNLGIEDILLCFFYGGIASTLYEFVFNDVLKKYSRESKKTRILEVVVAILSGIIMFLLFWSVFKISVIYASAVGGMAIGLVFIFFRKDLFIPAIVGGIIMSLLSFIILAFFGLIFKGIFDVWWRIDLLSGIRILSVPIEEIIWHFSLGFAAGPMYEVWKGYSDFKKNLS